MVIFERMLKVSHDKIRLKMLMKNITKAHCEFVLHVLKFFFVWQILEHVQKFRILSILRP